MNDDPDAAATERTLLLGYAPADARAGFAALLALDDRLGMILRTTREPLVGQMRLTWWHSALAALDSAPAPAEPVLRALAEVVVPRVAGATLATMVEGWEALLEPTLDAAVLTHHAAARGATLFAALAVVVAGDGGDATVAAAGRGWALADVARHVSDPRVAAMARDSARATLAPVVRRRWPAGLRAIGALTHLAWLDTADAPRPVGHPARAARMLWHRLSGR